MAPKVPKKMHVHEKPNRAAATAPALAPNTARGMELFVEGFARDFVQNYVTEKTAAAMLKMQPWGTQKDTGWIYNTYGELVKREVGPVDARHILAELIASGATPADRS